jgi:hypothetical protein
MTNWPTRESPPQVNEERPPRHRNVYDYDGEFEFCTVQHWTAPDGGHSANQNSFKSLAIATGPENCFFTSSAQDE